MWLRKTHERQKETEPNQSILREINPEHSLEGLMLKLKLQYFGHLMRTADSLGKTLMLGKIVGRRRKRTSEDEMVGWHHGCNGHELGQTLGDGEGPRGLACSSPWGCRRIGHDWETEQQHCFTHLSGSWRGLRL